MARAKLPISRNWNPSTRILAFPCRSLFPRARFRILDDRTRLLLEKLQLSADDVVKPRDQLVSRLVARAHAGSDSPLDVEARILGADDAELQRVGERMTTLDPGLAKAAARTSTNIRESVHKLMGKYEHALWPPRTA